MVPRLFEAGEVIGDFKHEHNYRHRHSARGYVTPGRVRRTMRTYPPPSAAVIGVSRAHRGGTVFSGADRVGLATSRSTTSAKPANPGAAAMSAAMR